MNLENVPDREFYRDYVNKVFHLWDRGGFPFSRVLHLSLIPADKLYVLWTLAGQALALPGDFVECGVYRGGSAIMLSLLRRNLHLFDTFEGMPKAMADKDYHVEGEFKDTSMEAVIKNLQEIRGNVDDVYFHKGRIPETFAGSGIEQIAFAHVDVDLYQSTIDCCEFIWPRLTLGGFMVFDDYGTISCPGQRLAVDEFFKGEQAVPLLLPNGQALVFKNV